MNIRHGTLQAYTHQKCRCTECRANWNEYHKAYQKARRAQAKIDRARLAELEALVAESEATA